MKVFEVLETGDPYEPDFTVAIAATRELAEKIAKRFEYFSEIRETEVLTSSD